METQQTRGNAAWWVVLGVMLGFGLPVMGLAVIIVAFGTAVGAVGDDGDDGLTEGDPARRIQKARLSGPKTGPAVAVVDIWGAIKRGEDGRPWDDDGDSTSSIAVVKLLEAARQDDDVKAVLLRVNSPGGSVVASDEIYAALLGLNKPVVAVMGEIAASGGVYVSMGASHVVAHPDTFTGSIGVIMSLATAEELLQKIGVRSHTIKSGKFKDIGNMARAPTDEERAQLQNLVEESYTRFVEIVAQSRKLSVDKVKAFADGRILSGRQALALGLVDALGTEKDGVAKAAELGGITGTPRLLQFRGKRAFLEDILESTLRQVGRGLWETMRSTAATPTAGLEYR